MPLTLPSVRADGQTIFASWFNTIRTALSDLETSLALSQDTRQLEYICWGPYNQNGAKTQMHQLTIKENITVSSVVLKVYLQGGSGSTTIDLRRYRSGYQSILTTQPSVPYTAGAGADSSTGAGATAAVINATYQDLLIGDLLDLDLSAVQGNTVGSVAQGFHVYVNYSLTGAL